MAELLTHGDPAAARALIRETFDRKDGDFATLTRSSRGISSLLARFAAVSSHHAYRVARLTGAADAASPEASAALIKKATPTQPLVLALPGSKQAADNAKISDLIMASIGSHNHGEQVLAVTEIRGNLERRFASRRREVLTRRRQSRCDYFLGFGRLACSSAARRR